MLARAHAKAAGRGGAQAGREKAPKEGGRSWLRRCLISAGHGLRIARLSSLFTGSRRPYVSCRARPQVSRRSTREHKGTRQCARFASQPALVISAHGTLRGDTHRDSIACQRRARRRGHPDPTGARRQRPPLIAGTEEHCAHSLPEAGKMFNFQSILQFPVSVLLYPLSMSTRGPAWVGGQGGQTEAMG